jgi:hypothetical protein
MFSLYNLQYKSNEHISYSNKGLYMQPKKKTMISQDIVTSYKTILYHSATTK